MWSPAIEILDTGVLLEAPMSAPNTVTCPLQPAIYKYVDPPLQTPGGSWVP